MVSPSKGRPPMNHRKTDSGILCRSKICQSSAKPGSEEWKAARKEIEKLDRQKKKRVPGGRHDQRMSALYVDASISRSIAQTTTTNISDVSIRVSYRCRE